jgi:hypothetical protein
MAPAPSARSPEEYSQCDTAPAKGTNVRTTFIALAFWALPHLVGCSDMRTVARSGPCAEEASYECQIERSSRVP